MKQDPGAGARLLLVVWVSLLVILVVAPLVILLMAPELYDQALRLPGSRRTELAVLAALSGLGSPTGKPSHAVGAGPDRFVVGADPGPPARPTRLVWWVASGLLRPGSASAAPNPTGRLLGPAGVSAEGRHNRIPAARW